MFTLSLHGERNFPFRKEDSDLDVPLPDGCGDAQYLDALEHALQTWSSALSPAWCCTWRVRRPARRRPAGAPVPLSYDGLEARETAGCSTGRGRRRVPLAFSMAGGYGHDIATTVQAQLNTWRVALQYHCCWRMLRHEHANPFLCRAQPGASPSPHRSRAVPTVPSIHQHPLGRQRCVRPCQQYRVLQLVSTPP